MRTLLVADLHLSEHTPAMARGFIRYLETTAKGARAVYILGDLFDAWVGDDLLYQPHPLANVARQVIQALRHLANSGTDVYFMHGNRDFLIGERFAEACQATLLPEVQEVELHDVPMVLLHGDSLCTRDNAYMAFRQQARNPEWQAQMLALPLTERAALAQQLRQKSGEANAGKAEDIMDVTPSEVITLMEQCGVATMIHGHTHRPRVHDFTVEDVPAKRYVLGDWSDSHGWDIVVEDGDTPHAQLRLRQFPLDEPPAASS
ncbi:MAG: UDP-2,3-diacylglucosamine diphosphatase [Halomonas sp.]|nr:UDP-2,3-diacylglucosamine diphosphatase [Halomonas sp.]MDN6297847.1 UDP-2,3-diacylglucosamine diphosphatase [Halomonas sp.]MDN6315154.1 UDP-2,3-diacylglucosamine diphosphatase [Halomonas sp.]MDN6336498.1 UDP-2,3-diacylglucosamine diphosphatase [Halomonas sp.]